MFKYKKCIAKHNTIIDAVTSVLQDEVHHEEQPGNTRDVFVNRDPVVILLATEGEFSVIVNPYFIKSVTIQGRQMQEKKMANLQQDMLQ